MKLDSTTTIQVFIAHIPALEKSTTEEVRYMRTQHNNQEATWQKQLIDPDGNTYDGDTSHKFFNITNPFELKWVMDSFENI